ncbi:APC family permease [[Eubacterium] cellulosolvens]
MASSSSKTLGVFALAMINVAAVLSLRNYPSMAPYGWSSVGWYIFGTLLFLIPVSLAGAELATGWPKGGGVYAWVREAFGEHSGFIAVFCEWSNNLVWFPTVLAFIASTFAYVINPELANSPTFMFGLMIVAFWGTTVIAMFGDRVTSSFGSFGAMVGSIVPAILIIVLGTVYLAMGRKLALPPLTLGELVPSINLGTLPFIATVVLLFAGMEMSGFYALSTRNPQKDYPRAMALSAAVIFMLTVLGTLGIAFVVPVQQLSLAAGIMQAFAAFLKTFGLDWLLAPLALLVTLGGTALLISWLNGPAKGLGEVAASGNMPPFFDRLNRHGAPVPVLILQAIIGTLLSMLYLFMPSVSAAYWVLSAMTVELLCIVYMLIFASVIKLRYSQPDTPRAYRIPGGKAGVWVVGGAGFASCLFTFMVGLLPPSIEKMPPLTYVLIMLAGTAVLALPPLVFMRLKKPNWSKPPQQAT